MLKHAYEQLAAGALEDAVEAFSDCLRTDPGEARSHYGRGMAYFQLTQWPAATADFRQAKALNPAEPEYGLALAMGLAMGSAIYEAIAVFDELLAAHPQYVRGHIQLAQLYYRLGVITKGHRQLDAALAARPTAAERKAINELKGSQLALDKRRYYRPDFEALRRQHRSPSRKPAAA